MTSWKLWPGQYVQQGWSLEFESGDGPKEPAHPTSLEHSLLLSRAVRQQKKPFGGIQLIICGDFLQLPPVTKGSPHPRFCFQVLLTPWPLTCTLGRGRRGWWHPDSDPRLPGESSLLRGLISPLPHQAKSWRRCVPVTLELTEVWRQADQTFISLLQAVRLGRWVLGKGLWVEDARMGLYCLLGGGRPHTA